MKQYIDKAAIVSEIIKIYDRNRSNGYIDICDEMDYILSFLNTLEVKEVDLEKEIELIKGDYEQVGVAWNNDFDFIAKHFYELGIKAKKGGGNERTKKEN